MAKHPKSPQGLEGADAKPINSKLKELEAQKERLKSALAEAPDDKPLLHPNLAEIYRTQVEILEAALREPDHGREAFEIVRSLNRAGEHCLSDGEVTIELKGELAGILVLAEGAERCSGSPEEKALQIKMVVGARCRVCYNSRYRSSWRVPASGEIEDRHQLAA